MTHQIINITASSLIMTDVFHLKSKHVSKSFGEFFASPKKWSHNAKRLLWLNNVGRYLKIFSKLEEKGDSCQAPLIYGIMIKTDLALDFEKKRIKNQAKI